MTYSNYSCVPSDFICKANKNRSRIPLEYWLFRSLARKGIGDMLRISDLR